MRRVLTAPARYLRRAAHRLAGASVALLYHRVADLASDPWALAVSPRNFEEHLDVLARHGRGLLARDLVKAMDDGRVPAASVVVTFDDGYADLDSTVRPLLERSGVPATMFIVSDAVGARCEFWWDVLDRIFLSGEPLPSRLRLTIGRTSHEWSLDAGDSAAEASSESRDWRAWRRPPTRRHAVYLELWKVMHEADLSARRDAEASLLGWAGLDPEARRTHRTLDAGELCDLAGSALIELGSHTISHSALAALPRAAQRCEIALGRRRLRVATGAAIRTFAYPFGRAEDYSATTVELVRRGGFAAGFVNEAGVVSARTDRYRIPRAFVADGDGDSLGRLLWRVAGIRTG